MPALARWLIKTSLVYLFLALLTGIVQGVKLPGEFGLLLASLYPVYIHMLAFGWLTQLIFGVAFWMFPKYSSDKPHANVAVGWVMYGSLNAGLVLRAVGEPLNAWLPNSSWGWFLVASAVLQWLAGLAFVLNTWGRVKVK